MRGLYTSLLVGIVGMSIATSFVRPSEGVALGGGAFDLFCLLAVVFLFEKLYRWLFKC